MTTQPPTGPAAGWYPHPEMANTQRYWDGAAWTEHIAPGQPARAVPAERFYREPEPTHGGLIATGYITAVLLPIVGFIIGIILIAKGKGGHGAGAMILAVLAFVFWAGQLTADTYYGSGY